MMLTQPQLWTLSGANTVALTGVCADGLGGSQDRKGPEEYAVPLDCTIKSDGLP